MYQRQVWKQLLSNKVLIDPKTQRFFKNSDLHDLFSLQEQTANPETSNIFRDSKVKIEEKIKRSKLDKRKATSDIHFSEDKIQAMKLLAQKIAKGIGKPEKPKTALEIELEAERKRRLGEKAFLKTLSPAELREYNRKKLEAGEDEEVNRLDDCETAVSFSKALEISEKTAEIYHNVKAKGAAEKEVTSLDSVEEGKRERSKTVRCGKVDLSGQIDGERIEGLVKREVKKTKEERLDKSKGSQKQDDYVLGKLFAKSGNTSIYI